MNIIKDLDSYQSGVNLWSYTRLDEVNRIAPIIKKLKFLGIDF